MSRKISFVFCTKTPEPLVAFLESARAAIADRSQYELIVVTPDPQLLATAINNDISPRAQAFSVQLVACPWGNRNTARNLGFQRAQNAWVHFLDEDVRLIEGDALTRTHAEIMRSPADVALGAGPYLTPKKTRYWGRAYNWMSREWLERARSEGRVLAGNAFIRKSAVQWAPGPFDERCISGGEEIVLCARLAAEGFRVLYRSGLAVDHHANHTFTRFFARHFYHAKVKVRLAAFEAAFTRVDRRLVREIFTMPQQWPAVVVAVLANYCGQRAAMLRSETHVQRNQAIDTPS